MTDEGSPLISEEMTALIDAVVAKRPRTVLDHIRKHGFVTTEELKTQYGYDHPPRAARDVKEQGIPLETFFLKGPNGRRMAGYRLGSLDAAGVGGMAGGRRAFPKTLKEALVARDGERCAICGASFPARALQVDHRIPYEVVGDTRGLDPQEFMLLDGSHNRAKSWSCEHCENWLVHKDPAVCATCYWASPNDYRHIAGAARRQATITWDGDEDVADFDRLVEEARAEGVAPSTYLKGKLSDGE